jgi:hypothetical protein
MSMAAGQAGTRRRTCEPDEDGTTPLRRRRVRRDRVIPLRVDGYPPSWGVCGDVVQLAPGLRRDGYRCGQGTQGAAEQNARLKRLLVAHARVTDRTQAAVWTACHGVAARLNGGSDTSGRSYRESTALPHHD